MFLIFNFGYTEAIAFRKLCQTIREMALVDWLTIIRHIFVSLYSWVLSPLLLNRLPFIPAFSIMLIYSILLLFLFVKIINGYGRKSLFLETVSIVFGKREIFKLFTLSIVEPYLFAIELDKLKIKKYFNVFLKIVSVIVATILWTIIITLLRIKI